MTSSERPSQSIDSARFSALARQISQLSQAPGGKAEGASTAEAPRHPPKARRPLQAPLGLEGFQIFSKPLRALRSMIALRGQISNAEPSRRTMGSGE